MAKLRVLLAEDHVALRDSLVSLLEGSYELVGAVGDGLSAVELAERLKPAVIILDIGLPELNGFKAALELSRVCPGIPIIFHTVHTNREYVREAVRVGASGYVLKASGGTELLNALREVSEGRRYLSQGLRGDDVAWNRPPA